jgi:signal transduction histidine kinase
MQHASRLFGAFQRLPSAAGFKGSGVGLAIVERIVRRHGGGIRAESTPGQGAVFRFTLPDKGLA